MRTFPDRELAATRANRGISARCDWHCQILLGVAALALLGCEREWVPLTPHPDAADIRDWVTPSVAASIDAEGKFVLPAPPPAPYPQIAPGDAVRLAEAYVRTFGRYNLPYFESIRKTQVDLSQLRPAARALYGIPPWEAPPESAGIAARKALGPYYFVSMESPAGEPVLSVSIPAYSTDTYIDENGRPIFYRSSGVFMTAVPPSWAGSVPMSPEGAVILAASATGARADAVPELLLPGFSYQPIAARWRVKLDRPVRIRSTKTGRVRSASEVYVGFMGELSLPETDQPASITVPLFPDPAQDARPGAGMPRASPPSISVSRRSGLPVKFEKVTPVHE